MGNEKSQKIKKEKSELNKRSVLEIIVLTVFFIFFVFIGITLIYPLVWVFLNSLKTSAEFYENSFSLPKDWLFSNYARAFREVSVHNSSLLEMAFNSVWIAITATTVSILCSSLTAYAMSKYKFPGKPFLYSIVILIQVLPLIGTGPAMYKFLTNAGITNNPFLIWLIWANGFDFAFIVLYGYFKSISWSYAESAFIDGASNFKVLWSIMYPQALPAIASLVIVNIIGAWNDYTTPMIYLKSYPNLALGIYFFDKDSQFAAAGTPVFFASVLMSMLPILLLFVCFQKMIMTNVTAGGLKG